MSAVQGPTLWQWKPGWGHLLHRAFLTFTSLPLSLETEGCSKPTGSPLAWSRPCPSLSMLPSGKVCILLKASELPPPQALPLTQVVASTAPPLATGTHSPTQAGAGRLSSTGLPCQLLLLPSRLSFDSTPREFRRLHFVDRHFAGLSDSVSSHPCQVASRAFSTPKRPFLNYHLPCHVS